MAKWYFTFAIVVGGLAISFFLLYNKQEIHPESNSSSHQTDKKFKNKPVSDLPQHKSQDRQGLKDDTKTKVDGKHTTKGESSDRETSKQDTDDDRSNNERPKIPEGHLKYLGEHGSPIITGEIEEIDFVPNGRDFYTHFARQRKPLVMRGAISHWPAVEHWANESYLRQNYGDVIFDVQLTKKYETVLPIKKTMTLDEYLDIYKKENVYLDCPFPQSKMTRDILVPYCLQCDEFKDTISSTHLLFSNGNTSSSLHYDGFENLLSVISGKKEVLVANYSYYQYFYNQNFTTVNIEAPIDPEAVDLIKYPKLAEVTFHKCAYFAVAVTVAGLALIVYFLLNDNLVVKLVGSDEKRFKSSEDNVLQSKSQDFKDDTTEFKTQSQSKTNKKQQTDKITKPEQDDKLQNKGKSAERLPQQPSFRQEHLKKLGEHGAPVIENFIEELDYVLFGKDFYEHFIRKRTPVMLRGAAKEWPAFRHWSNETYLREKYGNEEYYVEFTKKYENMPPIKKTLTLKEFLEIYKEEEVYLDSPIPHSAMLQDIVVPCCLQCQELLSSIRSVHLLYSNGGTSSSLHYDGYENLLTVFSGKKEVLLAHYNNSKFLLSDSGAKKYRSYAGLAALEPEAVDLLAFPYLLNITFYKVTINAGDILYIPQTWWHHVRSFDSPNIAISLWFGMFKDDSEQETNSVEDLDDVEMDSLRFIEKFGETVQKAPESIECRSQNRPISEVFWPKENDKELPKIVEPDAWTVTLNTGYKIPMKGFGTAGLLNDSEAATLVALKAGYRLIDTAQVDGYNETAVGCALKESGVPREDVFLVSKVVPRNMGYEDTIASIDQTLQNLQTSYVDLMLIHSPLCETEEDSPFACPVGYPRGTWRDCWKGLEEVYKKGKVRSIGVSNFEENDLKELMALATIAPAVVQNFFNPFYHDKGTRKYCKENNIKYMGHSTLGNGYVREGFEINPVLTDEGIKYIARSYDASPAQVVLKWALESDVIIIPMSRNPNHIETNFHLHHIFLSDKDKEYFEKLDGRFEQEDEEANQETIGKPAEQERKQPVRNKDIIDKLDLKKKVDPDNATIYISSDDQYIYAFDAKTGDVMWKYGTAEDGGSRCAFSPDESVVYCGTDDHFVRAFDRLDGTLLWKFETKGAVVSSTRVSDDGTLFVGCLDHYMYAINKDGSLKWKRHLGDQIWSSPALKDDGRLVFIGSMSENASNVYALDCETGEVIWDLKTAGPVFSSPALSQDQQVVYICSFDSNCYAFEAQTGKMLWVFESEWAFQSSPVVTTEGTMFVASTEGIVYALNSKNGKLVWKYKSEGEYFSSPFPAPNGLLYIGSGVGEVLALNQSNGKLVWSFKTELKDPIYSTPAMTKDGVLYIGGIDGYLYALRSDDGHLVWKYKTNGPLVGTPRIPGKHNMPKA